MINTLVDFLNNMPFLELTAVFATLFLFWTPITRAFHLFTRWLLLAAARTACVALLLLFFVKQLQPLCLTTYPFNKTNAFRIYDNLPIILSTATVLVVSSVWVVYFSSGGGPTRAPAKQWGTFIGQVTDAGYKHLQETKDFEIDLKVLEDNIRTLESEARRLRHHLARHVGRATAFEMDATIGLIAQQESLDVDDMFLAMVFEDVEELEGTGVELDDATHNMDDTDLANSFVPRDVNAIMEELCNPEKELDWGLLQEFGEDKTQKILAQRRRGKPLSLSTPLNQKEKEIARRSLAELGKFWRQHYAQRSGEAFKELTCDSYDLGPLSEDEILLNRGDIKELLRYRRANYKALKAVQEGGKRELCSTCHSWVRPNHSCHATAWTTAAKRVGQLKKTLVQQSGTGAISFRQVPVTDQHKLAEEYKKLNLLKQEAAEKQDLANQLIREQEERVQVLCLQATDIVAQATLPCREDANKSGQPSIRVTAPNEARAAILKENRPMNSTDHF